MPPLPNEIWLETLSKLSIWDLWALRGVSTLWHHYIQTWAANLASQATIKLSVTGFHEIEQYRWEGKNNSVQTAYNMDTESIHFWFNADGWTPGFDLEAWDLVPIYTGANRASNQLLAIDTEECFSSKHCYADIMVKLPNHGHWLYRMPFQHSHWTDTLNIYTFPISSLKYEYPHLELQVHKTPPYPTIQLTRRVNIPAWGSVDLPLHQI